SGAASFLCRRFSDSRFALQDGADFLTNYHSLKSRLGRGTACMLQYTTKSSRKWRFQKDWPKPPQECRKAADYLVYDNVAPSTMGSTHCKNRGVLVGETERSRIIGHVASVL